jgi:hypothetical protein
MCTCSSLHGPVVWTCVSPVMFRCLQCSNCMQNCSYSTIKCELSKIRHYRMLNACAMKVAYSFMHHFG